MTNHFISAPPAHENTLPTFEPGTQLDRFLIDKHLGHGSFADVYRAHDVICDREVAIKFAGAGPGRPNMGASRLHCEMAIYDLVEDRRHVLKTYGLHTVRWDGIDLVMLSMEYADGGTLRDLLHASNEDEGMAYEQVLECFSQICAGVDAIHSVGIVVGDIKPENIAIVNGVCKVCDLGHASIAQGVAIRASSFLRDTVEEGAVGTPEYVSPEQFVRNRSNMDQRSDIYSLGLVLREMIDPNGGPLFGNPYQRMRQLHNREAIPSLPDVDPVMSRVIARCLETDPSQRYDTVQDLLDDLQAESEILPSEPASGAEDYVETMWRNTCCCVTESRLDQAQRLCRQILEVRPNHEHAAGVLSDIEQRERRASQLYEAIDQGVGHRSLDQLCALLEEAVGTYPNYPQGQAVQKMLQSRAQDYRIAMEQGKEALCRQDWPAAQASFEKARQLNPGTSATEKAMRFLAAVCRHIHQERQLIDRATRAHDWDRAMTIARRLDESVDGVIRTASQPAGVESHDA